MPITDATVRRVKYPPELLPDSWFGALALNAEVAPPIMDLRAFSPYLLELTNIQFRPWLIAAYPNIRVRYDDVRLEQNTFEMLSYLEGVVIRGLPGAFRFPAKTQLYFNLLGTGVEVTYSTHFGVWAYPPTVAHKILWGITLDVKEQAINKELGISDTVEKGLLPMPISQLLEREYPVVGEETHTRNINIAAANTVFPVEVIYARPGEILVLTRIAASPSTVAQNAQLIIDRDNDFNYFTFPTLPLDLVAGGEVACFIPALTQIRLTTTAAAITAVQRFRYTFKRVKLNNILRVRFGLLSEADAPKDLFSKVWGGIV